DPMAAFSDVEFGTYHALVVGMDSYRHLPRLETAVNDAQAVAEVLKAQYGFEITLLTDASRSDIIEALDTYRATLDEQDNLLIYYAGHGWLDEDAQQGFWLPVDAKRESRVNWISNDSIRDAARAMKAKHVLVVADSCFSGTLTRSVHIPNRTADYLRRMASKRARLALSSGGLEPVADATDDGRHSPFARSFIEALRANDGVIDGTELFSQLRHPVMVNADQTPEYADIRRAGHDGGDFLFVRR
ncbi:MAG: caspase family protein, partial [Rhodocyclaceae bacterium]|nr:caspase family protein [Rhodocyclaceae bacterium]